MSLCETCYYKMLTWSEELRDKYNGCGILLLEKHLGGIEIENEQDIFNIIDAEQIAFGWITNGRIATNDQLIIKNCISCKKYISKKI